MLPRVRDHLSDFRLRNLISKDPAYPFALGVDLEHDAGCFRAIHRKEALQDVDDELHGGIVVIDQNDLIERRAFELGRRLFDDQAGPFSPALALTHGSLVYRVGSRPLQDAASKSARRPPLSPNDVTAL